jgi:4-alpha-glucanotransferase
VPDSNYTTFIEQNSWVHGYAIYQVFSEMFRSPTWSSWPKAYQEYPRYQNVDISKYQKEITYQMFLQYIFYTQWWEIKKIANDNNITIFGDIPFYVDIDSVEVWQEPKAFLLNTDGKPTMVAGVPPDYFSATGQNWGNPIYDWQYLTNHAFSFWIERLRFANQLFDEIRIDHFRAFDTYWMIPANEKTAIHGSWQEAPGYTLLDTIYQEIKDIHLIAEDLGDIRQEVTWLKDTYRIPGMKVFQFQWKDGFDSLDNTLLYTGTHDNETIVGWYNDLSPDIKGYILSMIHSNEEHVHLKIIKYCLGKANYVMVPIWDVLGLDNHARFNVPGTIDKNNWSFRIPDITKIEKAVKTMKYFID